MHCFLSLFLTLTGVPMNAISVPGSVVNTTSHYAHVGGNTYHYLRSRPSTAPTGTILLLHGYPDLAYGWRYQIPFLASLGYQVIAPDMLGYADTDAPAGLPEYTKRKLSTDMALLMDQIVPGEQIIVGGHDWGAALLYKMAIWYPDLIKAYFTFSVPYWPPLFGVSGRPFIDIPELVLNETYKTMGYQRQWRYYGFERNFETETEIYWLMNAVFGGETAQGQSALSTFNGWDLELLPHLQTNTLVNASDMDFYVLNMAKKGLLGPENWYRTYHLDWQDELPIAQARKQVYHVPALFIPGSQDSFFPHETWTQMKQYFDNLIIEPLDTGHWVMQQAPGEVNQILKKWLSGLA